VTCTLHSVNSYLQNFGVLSFLRKKYWWVRLSIENIITKSHGRNDDFLKASHKEAEYRPGSAIERILNEVL
jgi:hypothetical protein